MSFIKDTFLGGAEDRAAGQQVAALEGSQQFIREGIQQAREDAIPLFEQAGQTLGQGFQGALDVFGQTVPQQLQAFQGGNVGAQQTLLAGLPEAQAAILGGQLNPNALQAQTLNLPDFSTFQRFIPGFRPEDLAAAPTPDQPIVAPQFPGGGFPSGGFPGAGGPNDNVRVREGMPQFGAFNIKDILGGL